MPGRRMAVCDGSVTRQGGSVAVVRRLKERARTLKRDTLALYLAVRDRRTPWYARLLAGVVLAYALSPFDLIPDFIPILGYVDDLILVPAGIALVLRLIPAEVMADCRERASAQFERPISRIGAAAMIVIWLAAGVWAFFFVRGLLAHTA
jgi:uncharacterized membrane protein YkvA (DUF1232 family)